MEFYVFDNEQNAINAENYISVIGKAPITGNRQSDGEPQPNKQKTLRWAIPWQRATDNKWVFPRVPETKINQFPQSIKDKFDNDYPHSIENYEPSWKPKEDYN